MTLEIFIKEKDANFEFKSIFVECDQCMVAKERDNEILLKVTNNRVINNEIVPTKTHGYRLINKHGIVINQSNKDSFKIALASSIADLVIETIENSITVQHLKGNYEVHDINEDTKKIIIYGATQEDIFILGRFSNE